MRKCPGEEFSGNLFCVFLTKWNCTALHMYECTLDTTYLFFCFSSLVLTVAVLASLRRPPPHCNFLILRRTGDFQCLRHNWYYLPYRLAPPLPRNKWSIHSWTKYETLKMIILPYLFQISIAQFSKWFLFEFVFFYINSYFIEYFSSG